MRNLFHANVLFLRGLYKEAFDEYMEIVKAEQNATAAANIGYMYYRGIGVEQNYKKALAFFEAAAPLDEGVSFFNLALMYMRGHGIDVDLEKSAELMKDSANQGCPNAMLYLGTAHILGYLFDPVEIECISLIPFYQVIYRDANTAMLCGMGEDYSMEDKRYEVLEADESEAINMYIKISRLHARNPWFKEQTAMAQFMLGRAYLEGIGVDYMPRVGYRLIYNAAIDFSSIEAAQYILANADTAICYGVDVDKVKLLVENEYFNSSFNNRFTSSAHDVGRMLKGKQDK